MKRLQPFQRPLPKRRKAQPLLSPVAEPQAPTTAFVDYLHEREHYRVTTLVRYVGEVETNTIGYRIGNRLVKANNDLIGSITGIPAQMRDNWNILSSTTQRRQLARGLIDENGMTTRHRKALLSMLLWGGIVVYLVAALVLGIVNREALGTYQSVWSLFFYSLATSLFLPTPFEILLGNAVDNLGVFWTILVASFAKTLGAYLVLLAGDKASAGLDTLMVRRPRMYKIVNLLRKGSKRFGLYFVFILFAIPFMSDTAPLFLAALMGFKKWSFLAVMFVAVCLRSLLFIYAADIFAFVG